MALAFLNNCRWRSVAGALTDFEVASALTGGYVPADCLVPAVVNGATYHYFAISDDGTQHEEGDGPYNTGTGVLSRTTIRNSSTGAKVNFSAAPKVHMGGPLAGDMTWRVIGDTTVSSPVSEVRHAFAVADFVEIKSIALTMQCASTANDPPRFHLDLAGQEFNVVLSIAAIDASDDVASGASAMGRFQVTFDELIGSSAPFSSILWTNHLVSHDSGSEVGNSGFTGNSALADNWSGANGEVVWYFEDFLGDPLNTVGGRVVTYGLVRP